MPEVECPIEGCNYKTANLDESVVIALINAHCGNHASPVITAPTKSEENTLRRTSTTNSESSSIQIKLSFKKLTLKDLRRNSDILVNFIGLTFCIVSLIMDLALSFSQPYWYHIVDKKNVTSSVGLWKACIVKEIRGLQTEVQSTCISHNEYGFLSDYTVVGGAQVFQCLGIIFIPFSIVSIFLKLFLWRNINVLTTLGASHAFWAGISFLGSTAFVSNGLKKIPHVSYMDFSSTFAIFSGVVALLGSLTLISRETANTLKDKETNTSEVDVDDHTYQELII